MDSHHATVTFTIVGTEATAPGFIKKPTAKPTATARVTGDLFQALAAMYDWFNAQLFDGALLPVVLNFSRQANSMGFFAPERWVSGETSTHEISINPTYMARDARETAQTLVHEMTHCWQQEFGKPGRKGYHNEQWASKMDGIGLAPSSTGKPGGRRVGYKMADYPVPGGLFEQAYKTMPDACKFPWLCREGSFGGGGSGSEGEKKKPASKVKFTCPGCDCNAWGKPTLHIACADCEQSMVAENPDGATGENDTAERAIAGWRIGRLP